MYLILYIIANITLCLLEILLGLRGDFCYLLWQLGHILFNTHIGIKIFLLFLGF